MALGLGLNTGVLALPEVGALEESLSTAEAAIVHAEAELKLTLTSHDADEIRAAGTRLREIKQRRLVILRDLESARAERDRLEAAEALGRRPALMRRLEELQGELNEAAAAYEARPTGSRAARLRRLTMEETELRELLRQAEESTGAGAP